MKRSPTASLSNRLCRNAAFLPALVCLVAMAGCGDGRPTRVPVAGKVSIDGKSLNIGAIGFKPVGGGRIGGGRIETDGSYFITMYEKGDGLTPGKYTVAISAMQPVNNTSQRWHAPKRYASHETSELVVEIDKANSDMDFELTWEGDEHEGPWVEKY